MKASELHSDEFIIRAWLIMEELWARRNKVAFRGDGGNVYNSLQKIKSKILEHSEIINSNLDRLNRIDRWIDQERINGTLYQRNQGFSARINVILRYNCPESGILKINVDTAFSE